MINYQAIVGVMVLCMAFAGLNALQNRAHRARRQALAKFASSIGWSFTEKRDDRARHFGVFQCGYSGYTFNTMYGALPAAAGMRAQAGDASHSHGTGKGSTEHRFSYLMVQLPFATPALQLRPFGWVDKAKSALGFEDIEFESTEFRGRYLVKCQDRFFAHSLFDRSMIEVVLRERPIGLEIAGGQLCIADGSGTWDVQTFRAQLEFAERFLAQWPEHLKKELENANG